MARNTVAQTAFGPMLLAAVEHNEVPDRRLVDDDLAQRFLPAPLRALVAATRIGVVRRGLVAASERGGPGMWANIACRKRYIDAHLRQAMSTADAPEAVVILGAGLDTRGYRLARTSPVPVYEVDQPVNIARKARVVRDVLGRQPDSVRLVAVDFEHDDLMAALARHGHDATGRTFFIWEGVTQYLSPDGVHATLAQLRSAASSSRLVFTHVRRGFIDGTDLYGCRSLYRRFRERRQVWQFGIEPPEVAGLLSPYGWRLAEQAGPQYFQDHYIRPAHRELSASELEWSAYAVRP